MTLRLLSVVPLPLSPFNGPPVGTLIPVGEVGDDHFYWEGPPLPDPAELLEAAAPHRRDYAYWFRVFFFSVAADEEPDEFERWLERLEAAAIRFRVEIRVEELSPAGGGRWHLRVYLVPDQPPSDYSDAPAEPGVIRRRSQADQDERVEQNVAADLADALAGTSVCEPGDLICWELARRGLRWKGSSGSAGSYHFLDLVSAR